MAKNIWQDFHDKSSECPKKIRKLPRTEIKQITEYVLICVTSIYFILVNKFWWKIYNNFPAVKTTLESYFKTFSHSSVFKLSFIHSVLVTDDCFGLAESAFKRSLSKLDFGKLLTIH